MITKSNYLTYTEAKDLLNKSDIKSQRQYNEYTRGRSLELRLPAGPRKFYKKTGWVSWVDYLSNDNGHNFYSYDECVKLVREKDIKSKKGYNAYRLSSGDRSLPTNPKGVYKEWVSWYEFLNKEKPIFLSYDDAKSYARKLGMISAREWQKWAKNRQSFIPYRPDKVYKEWTTWMDFLGYDFLSYKDAKEYLKDKGLYSIVSYTRWYDKNKIDFIPKIAHKYYVEFTNYEDYLNIDPNHSNFMSYEDAKIFIKSNNINTQREYKIWKKRNKIDFLPHMPERQYGEWVGWCDYLTKDSIISTGASIVEKYLQSNNIEYIKEKKFKDCRNKLSLPFDFYLENLNVCIEYDGQHHYMPVSIHGGESGYERRLINDQIKNDYCKNNNIELIRIPYWDVKIINEILDKKIKEIENGRIL